MNGPIHLLGLSAKAPIRIDRPRETDLFQQRQVAETVTVKIIAREIPTQRFSQNEFLFGENDPLEAAGQSVSPNSRSTGHHLTGSHVPSDQFGQRLQGGRDQYDLSARLQMAGRLPKSVPKDHFLDPMIVQFIYLFFKFID